MSAFVNGKKYKVVTQGSQHCFEKGSIVEHRSGSTGLSGAYSFIGKDKHDGKAVEQVLFVHEVVEVNFLAQAKGKKKMTKPSGKQNLWVVEGQTNKGHSYSRTVLTRESARSDKRNKQAAGYTGLQIVRFNRSIVVR